MELQTEVSHTWIHRYLGNLLHWSTSPVVPQIYLFNKCDCVIRKSKIENRNRTIFSSVRRYVHIASVAKFVLGDTITYPLFADADTGIYPHAAPQYHARPKAKRGIAMLSVDKSLIRSKQGVTNLSHAQTIFVTFWNVSAALKSQPSH